MVAEKVGFAPPKPTPDAKLGWLSIQAKDGHWHWAEGRIDGPDLVVSSEDAQDPVAVRYAYTNHPTGPLLYNKAGLPVGPFSTIGYLLTVPPARSEPGQCPSPCAIRLRPGFPSPRGSARRRSGCG